MLQVSLHFRVIRFLYIMQLQERAWILQYLQKFVDVLPFSNFLQTYTLVFSVIEEFSFLSISDNIWHCKTISFHNQLKFNNIYWYFAIVEIFLPFLDMPKKYHITLIYIGENLTFSGNIKWVCIVEYYVAFHKIRIS